MFIFQTGSEDNELHTGSLETIRSQSIMGCNRKGVDNHGVPRVHKILKSVRFMQSFKNDGFLVTVVIMLLFLCTTVIGSGL